MTRKTQHQGAKTLMKCRTVVKIQWVPGYMGVEENGMADEVVKEAKEKAGT